MARKASEAYLAKLQDPRWQRRRLEVLSRDRWSCQRCRDTTTTLHVHHRSYIAGRDPWDYEDGLLVTLCAHCHETESSRRPDAEEELLRSLRRVFWWDDVTALADGFDGITAAHSSATVSDALAWLLADPERLSVLVVSRFLDESANEPEHRLLHG